MALSLPLSTEKLIQLGEVLCQHFPEMNLDEITQQIERERNRSHDTNRTNKLCHQSV